MLPPLHSAPHKTSRCLLSSFIRLCFTAFTWQTRCLLHSETNSSTDSSSLQWTLHLLSSALPPTPAQEVTWAWPSGTSSCPRREHRREGRKALRFPWGTSLLWVTAEADTLQQSSRQDWGPPLHKSSRSECSKTFVSRPSHPLPCAEMWSYSFLFHPLYSLKLTRLPPQTHPESILPKTHMAHEVNPLGLAVLSPGKSDAADHSSASFQGLQQSCDVCFPLRIYPINLFAYFTATM